MKIVFTIILTLSFSFYTGCTAVGITIGHFIGLSTDEEISLSPDSLKQLSKNDKIIIQMKNNDIHSGYFSSFSMTDKGNMEYSDTTKMEFPQEHLNESWQIRIKDGNKYFNYPGSEIIKIETSEKNYNAIIPAIIGITIDIYILSNLSFKT